MNSRRSHRALIAVIALLIGCTHQQAPVQPSPFPIERNESIDSIARAYVRVALALGERDPDSLDFATVPPSLREQIHQLYPTYEAIDRETARLVSALEAPPQNKYQLRAQFIEQQLHAVHTRILTLQGHPLPFVREAAILFDTQPLPDTAQAERAATRTKLLGLLPPTSQTPSARYAAFDRQFLVPPNLLPAVMTAALTACRGQTLAYLILPPNESIDLTFVRNQPWSAFSRFHGDAHSTIAVNTDYPITIDQALELACHEGYPGHHVFNTLRDIALAQQQGLPEATVQLTFSPQSYLSESAAAFAPRLAFTPEERLRVERDILFPLAGLPPAAAERYARISALVRSLDTAQPHIAQQYLDGQLEFVRAAQQLQTEALMQHPEATLLYLNEYRSYMLAYTDGPRRIATQLDLPRPAEDRHALWSRYVQLTQTSDPLPHN